MIRFEMYSNPDLAAIAAAARQGEQAIKTELGHGMRGLMARARSIYKQEMPRRTGRFASAAEGSAMDTSDGALFALSAPAPLNRFIRLGTRAHKITGNPWLAFEMGGRLVVVRSVNHPGTKGNDYALRTARRIEPMLRAVGEAAGRRYEQVLTG